MQNRQIGVNVVSLFPRLSLKSAHKIARDAHCDLQLLPLANYTREILEQIPPESVLSYEGAWTICSWWEAMQTGITKRDPGELLCPLLFGKSVEESKQRIQWMKELFPNAIGIDCDGLYSDAIEIDVKWGMSKQDFLDYPGKLVVDPRHMREFIPDTDELSWFLIELVELDKIALIHFQPDFRNTREYHDFMWGKTGFLTQYLQILSKTDTSVGVVIEVDPRRICLNQRFALRVLRDRILQRIS